MDKHGNDKLAIDNYFYSVETLSRVFEKYNLSFNMLPLKMDPVAPDIVKKECELLVREPTLCVVTGLTGTYAEREE